MNTGTQLLKGKLNINLRATMDPYAINANGTRINTFNIDNGGSLFRLTNAGLTSGYSIKSTELGKNKDKTTSTNRHDNQGSNESESSRNRLSDNRPGNTDQADGEIKVAKLYQNQMPWDVRLQYSLTYSNFRGDGDISSNSVQVTGNLEFSPKWRVGVSSGYDFENNGITYTQLRFERDLDSWRFSFNWIPFGDRATYYFFIGVKQGLFSDLKYHQRMVSDKRLF